MISKRNIAIIGLVTCLASYASNSYAATINVNTTDMTIDVTGNTDFIDLDTSATPAGRSGLYKPDSITIEDLEDISKNPADSNTGAEPAISLPEAIIAANNTPGADLIILQANEAPYTLSTIHNYWYGPNALPPITSEITIRGDGLPEGDRPKKTDKGAIIQRASGAPNMRLFFVMGGSYALQVTDKAQVGVGALSLINLHIKNGYAKGGNGSGGGAGLGGAIFNQGLLSVNGITFSDNTAEGGDGNNTVDLGGGGVGGDANGKLGGGFYSTEFIGTEQFIHPSNSSLDTFTSIFGGNGGPGGSGGFGPLDDNGVNGGGPAPAGNTTTLSAFGAGGGRAANTPTDDGYAGAFGSGGGYGVKGGNGGFGGGGGQSSLAGNESQTGFAGGKGTSVSGGGGAGLGGAIFNHNGLLVVQNSTFSANQVIGGSGDFGGSAYGAAIFSANAQSFNGNSGLNIFHTTIFNNTCTEGPGSNTNGSCDSPVYTIGITGPGVQDGVVDATATIVNSIIANPETINYSSLSNNKLGSSTGSTLTLSSKNIIRRAIFNGTDAILNQTIANTIDQDPFPNIGDPLAPNAGVLADNGGLTETILPYSTTTPSPAIDAVIDEVISVDQRRVARPKDTTGIGEADQAISDIGSVETGENQAPVINTRDDLLEFDIDDSSPSLIAHPLLTSGVFTIDDPDAGLNSGLDIEVTITVTNGNGLLNIPENTFNAYKEAGVDFGSLSDAVDKTTITMTAPLSALYDIRAFFGNIFAQGPLAAVTLTPTSAPETFIEVQIEVDDLGNSGDVPNSGDLSLKADKTLKFNVIGTPPQSAIVDVPNTTPIPELIGNSVFSIGIVFNEDITGFDSSDIQITNGSLASPLVTLTEKRQFIANIIGDGKGDIVIVIPANAVEDDAGIKNTASNTVTIKYDIDKPVISTSGIPATAGSDEFTARFIFDEDVSGFTIEDIQITNGTLSDFEEIDGRTYSVVVTPDLISGIRYSIKEDIASDAAGNGNKALNEKLIPLQVGGSGSGSSYNPLFSLIILILFALRRRINP